MTTQIISPIPFIDDYEPEMFVSESTDEITRESEDTMNQNEEKPAPIDPYGIVKIVFYLLGTSVLLPWFFFITCNDYWMYRFRNLQNTTTSFYFHLSLSDNGSNRTTLQADFTSYISIASTVPCTLFLFVNMFYLRKFSIHWRIVISSIIVLIFFAETTVLVLFNSDSWQFLFFIITLATVVILNVVTAILQATLSALFMRFPVSYISASTFGQSLAGIFAAVAQISVLLINASPTKSTFLYFVFADVTVVLSLLGYLYVRKTEFFSYYANKESPDVTGSNQYRRLYNSDLNLNVASVDYMLIFKKTWVYTVSILLCFLITCAVYPSIAVLVCSVDLKMKSQWVDEYFVPVITYLLYSVCEYCGRVAAGVIQKPKGNLLVWLSVLRVVFVPLLMLCNAQPRHNLPVLINSDLWYALIIILLAFSNGYIVTLTFILIPNSILVHEQEVASTMLITSLAAGLSIGSLISFPLVNSL